MIHLILLLYLHTLFYHCLGNIFCIFCLIIKKHIKIDNQHIHITLFDIYQPIESSQYIEIHKDNLDNLDQEIIKQYNDGG